MSHLEILSAELARLDRLIEAELRRMRARYELSLDELHGLYVTDQRVDALLAQHSPLEAAAVPDLTEARAADLDSRWCQLGEGLQLTEDERDVLLICLAPEFDAKYETLYAYLNDDVTRRSPTLETIVRLLARDAEHRSTLRAVLLPSAKLLATGALELTGGRDEARGRRPLRAARPLADWVQGLAYVDERLTAVARFGGFEILVPDAAFPVSSRAAIDGLVTRLREWTRLPPVILSATSSGEAALVAEDLFARAERLVLVLDVGALRSAAAPAEVIAAIDLAQHVLQVGVIASPLEALGESDGRPDDPCVAAIRRLARRSPSMILATSAAGRARDLLGDQPSIDLVLPEPGVAERAAAWSHVLEAGTAAQAWFGNDEVIDALADRFVLGMDRILKAANVAREAASLDGAAWPTRDHLFAAARAVSTETSGGMTQTITTLFEWEDLILPADVKARLDDVVNAIERRSRVLDAWQFARRVGGRRGVTIMFAGASGTGKTMAASILAKRLQLDLHRLELGAVVSKYIGETEKNLDKAFDAARRANAVLFIDEADALLGKRSQVKDAHDRYANVEVAYLLQKIEDAGIVIVATNLAQNLDEAFSRRMQYAIEFPLPDAVSRERLWRGMIPSAAPVAGDIDFSFLGRQFELSGGDIRNIVLDAAYRAAQGDGPITFEHLLLAVARQYVKRGHVPTPADFREHYALLLVEGPAGQLVQ